MNIKQDYFDREAWKEAVRRCGYKIMPHEGGLIAVSDKFRRLGYWNRRDRQGWLMIAMNGGE